MSWIIAALVSVGVFGVVALGAWARRGEMRPDRAGERTLVIFNAPPGTTPSGDDPPGEQLARDLADGLRERGMDVDDVQRDDGRTWAFCADGAYLALGHLDEDQWRALVLDPSSGGPGSIAVACAVDEVLRRTSGVSFVRWYRRETGDGEGEGWEHPVEPRTRTYR